LLLGPGAIEVSPATLTENDDDAARGDGHPQRYLASRDTRQAWNAGMTRYTP
jgi:hypothetical protein